MLDLMGFGTVDTLAQSILEDWQKRHSPSV
jgi:hypothetical protein